MKKRNRLYRPFVTSLESRELLAYQIMHGVCADVTATVQGGPNTTLQPTPAVNHFSSFDGSVGSQFMIQVENKAHPVSWAPEATPYELKSVHYETPHGLSLNTTYTIDYSQAIPMTDTTHNFNFDWIQWQDSIGGYLDQTVADIDFTITVSFYGRNDFPTPKDETFAVEIDTEAPQGALGSSWPTNGPDGFHFGLWSQRKEIAGAWVDTNSPVSSKDTDLLESLDGDPHAYSIGIQSPGIHGYEGAGVTFAALAYNTTKVYGRFSIWQVFQGKIEARRVQSQYFGAYSTTGSYLYESHKDSAGNYVWGLDEQTWHPQSGRNYGAAPGQTVSLTNPWPEYPETVYFDSPSFQYGVSSDADNYLTYMDYNAKFETSLVWQPDYGIPIVITTQPWQLNCHYENPTVLAHPSFANEINPANWTGSASITHAASPVLTPRMLRPYDYNAPLGLDTESWNDNYAWVFGFQVSGAASSPQSDIHPVFVTDTTKKHSNHSETVHFKPAHRKGLDVHHVARHVVSQKENRWQTFSHGTA